MWIESVLHKPTNKPADTKKRRNSKNLWTTKWLTYQMKDQLSTIQCYEMHQMKWNCILIENYFVHFVSYLKLPHILPVLVIKRLFVS